MAIKLYWCRGKGRSDSSQQNFGDYLSPLIVEMMSGKKVEYAPINRAEMMAIGSILPREKKAKGLFWPRRLHIWGAGTDAEGLKFSGRHYYHAVRGVKSLDQIDSLKEQPALGDPGLLSKMWWEGKAIPSKKYRIGFIPHYVDHLHPIVDEFRNLKDTLVINVFSPVEDVLRDIQSCEFIVSSSMHGLIVADSFGVPNRRVRLSAGKISDYKFSDYYSAFGMEEPRFLEVSEMLNLPFTNLDEMFSDYQRDHIDSIQQGLIESFPSI